MHWEDRKSPECMDKGVVPNDERVDERIDEGVHRWFGHVDKMENDSIAKGVYVGECAASRSGLIPCRIV